MSIYDKYPPYRTKELIRDVMKAGNLSGAELARQACVAQSTVCRVYRGRCAPSMRVYMALIGVAREYLKV